MANLPELGQTFQTGHRYNSPFGTWVQLPIQDLDTIAQTGIKYIHFDRKQLQYQKQDLSTIEIREIKNQAKELIQDVSTMSEAGIRYNISDRTQVQQPIQDLGTIAHG